MKKLLIILFLLCSVIANATDYYVKNGGNDGYTGLSDGQAWATIAKVNGSSFSAGDNIYFKRGDTWRETLTLPSSGTSGAYITIGAYGTGDDPQIFGSTEVTTWVQGTIIGAVASNDLVEESFEGVGYEESWTETLGANESNSIDEDNTDIARPTGGGSQLIKIVKDITPTGTSAASRSWTERDLGSNKAVTYSDFYVYINAHGLSANNNTLYIYRMLDSGWDNVSGLVLSNVSGAIKFRAFRYNNGSEDAYNYPLSGSITLNQWYHVQILYDVTNHNVLCTIDGNYVYSGALTGTHKAGVQHVVLGDGSNVFTSTVYYDLVNISSTNFYSADYVLPANTWASNNTMYHPYSLDYYGNAYFKETNGDISWGRVMKTSIASLTVEYDWAFYNGHIVIYSPTNPNTRYSGAEVSQRLKGIDINNKEYITIDGIEVAYVGSYGISELWPATNIVGLIVKNCHVHHIGIKGSNAAYGIENWHSHSVIQNNTIHDTGRRGISINIYEGNCQLHNVIIEGNACYNGNHTTGPDISSYGATSTIDSVIIRNNYIYDDPTVNNDEIELFRSAGIFAEMEGVGSVSKIYVYNNIVKNTSYIALLFMNIPRSYIYNNTFYGVNPYETEDYDGMVEILGTTTTTAIKNNIIYNNNVAATRVHYACIFENATGTLDINYNLYYNTDAATDLARVSGTSYLSSAWTTYKTATGWDANSPTPANPLFVSSSDYRLQSTSPAKDAGVTIPIITNDYNLRTRPHGDAFDIGAYESGVWVIIKDGQVIVKNEKTMVL